NVLCNVNIQHSCATAGCTGVQVVSERQECNETIRTTTVVNHSPANMFLLNTHALHNYRRIAAATP
ncbi:hypothetical protein PAXRUDRAFT_126765, partial [Paxillus rubicundulus Ve08.2h10]